MAVVVVEVPVQACLAILQRRLEGDFLCLTEVWAEIQSKSIELAAAASLAPSELMA